MEGERGGYDARPGQVIVCQVMVIVCYAIPQCKTMKEKKRKAIK